MQTLLTLVLEYKEEKFKENNPNKSRTFVEYVFDLRLLV